MLTRILSGVVGLTLLFVVLLSHQIAVGIGVFILSLIGINEFYNSVSKIGYKPIKLIGFISCVPTLLIGLNGVLNIIDNYIDLFKSLNYFSIAIYVIIVFLLSVMVFKNKKYKLIDIAVTVFGILYVPFLMSFVILTRNLQFGSFIIWFIFIGAWATDTFAYFTGVFFGKKKILPEISPKKTIEGTVGGIIGCTFTTMAYGLLINNYLDNTIPMQHLAILGMLSGSISQLGDWGASAIKRFTKIKDFGKVIPGHGGVLDRFDSVLLIGPLVYYYFSMFFIK